ncbi:hypothetical protein V6N12_029227 [Hibiscus sabdariffa]|uniref:Gnk2-homologous domain-containing protein n=1 Tax=Hibiscus sabdariffa TaxID=183260 RepID=A0ABR2CVH1_9ROSI
MTPGRKCQQISMVSIHLLVLVLSLLNHTSEAQQPTYAYHFCSNTTNFSINSTYQANRDALLSSLSYYGTRGEGFYNTTSGRNPDMVYGLFGCLGDLSTNECQACVTFATNDISRLCRIKKTAVIWYDGCVVRYSDRNMFSIVTEAPRVAFIDSMIVTPTLTEQDHFDPYILSIINDTASLVEIEPAGPINFATKEENVSKFQTLSILVQCTPDISGTDCGRCLRGAIAYLPSGLEGGTSFNPSCIVRYEFNPSYAALPPSARGAKWSMGMIMAVICAAALVLALIIGSSLVYTRLKKRTQIDEERSQATLLYELASPKEVIITQEGQLAWRLWKEGKELELIDPGLLESCSIPEIDRCIHIGLLCVQEDPTDRPTMSDVVVILGSNTITLPEPKRPAFSVGRMIPIDQSSTTDPSINQMIGSNISVC